ncbi:uncharacterized protein PgNI_09109 [Pyricularia grisea]|uniref:Uncharacterized protein n=1 Tax=Pyricularia grisea TaxID=148305 RepID=A0A6P8ATY7_PYRGI|nr:uncharacterized protein PgNI_09109 [Pyricularia grisea]TLD05585.1 hypothetical protein PgNI_09109 [Pyricularia grisea]
MNILVDPTTGNVTGIFNWAEAAILPFGFSLWGMGNIMGYMDFKGWQASNVSDVHLHSLWSSRMVGFFCRYGFIMEGNVMKGVVDLSDFSSMAYLDAFCRADDWAVISR